VVDGVIRYAPYAAVVGLFTYLTGRRLYLFDVWCIARGLDPWRLPLHRLFNLVYYHIHERGSQQLDEAQVEHLQRLENVLTGPMELRRRVTPVDPLAGRGPQIPRPAWWTDDEDE